jgi:hypothetical protein
MAPGISGEVLEERWHMATTELREFANESYPSECNSKAIESLSDAVRELAVRMVHELHDSEENALEALWGRCLDHVQSEITEFAVDIEATRAAKQNGAAA